MLKSRPTSRFKIMTDENCNKIISDTSPFCWK